MARGKKRAQEDDDDEEETKAPSTALVRASDVASTKSKSSHGSRAVVAAASRSGCVCAVCLRKSSQKDVRFPTDENGQPTGNGCLDCKETAVQISPGTDFPTVCKMYHDKDGHPMYKSTFDFAKSQLRMIEKKVTDGLKMWKPSSNVARATEMGHDLYREMGAPTEHDVLRIFGVSPSELDLVPVTLLGEENTSLNVYLIYLEGIPERHLAGLRKLKLSCAVKIVKDENFVTPATQILAEQGATWFSHLSNNMVTSRDDQMVDKKKRKRTVPQTWEQVASKAQQLLALRRQNVAEAFDGSDQEIQDDGSQEDNEKDNSSSAEEEHGFGENPPKRRRRVELIQDPTDLMALALGAESEKARAKAKAKGKAAAAKKSSSKPKKAKGAEKEDSEQEEDEQLEDLSHDLEMKAIAERHFSITGKVAPSFANLDVNRFLSGEKLGQALVGAKRCQSALQGTKEGHSLAERLSTCSAAHDVANRLAALEHHTLVCNLGLLKANLEAFPISLMVKVTAKLYAQSFGTILSVEEAPEKDFSTRVDRLVKSFQLWRTDCEGIPDLMNDELPSFQPVIQIIKDRFKCDEDSQPQAEENGDDVDDSFNKLLQTKGQEEETDDAAKPTDRSQADLEDALKVLNVALLGVLQDDCFINLLNHVADGAAHRKLTAFSSAFLKALDGKDLTDFSSTKLGQAVAETMQDALRFHKLVCNLLQVDTSTQLTEKELLYFDRYKGSCTFRKAVKALMNVPEPDGPNKSEVRVASRELLRQAKVDIVKTSATAGPAETKMNVYIQQLQNISQIEPGFCQVLADVVKDMKGLGSKLRAGKIKNLQDAVAEFAKDYANKVLESSDCNVASQDVDTMLAALSLSSEKKGCTEIKTKLQAWATEHNAQIRLKELQKMMTTFVEQAKKATTDSNTTVAFNGERGLELLPKETKKGLSDEQKQIFQEALPWLLKMVMVQVAGGEEVSQGLLSCIKFLANLIGTSGTPHQALAANQMKMIKASLMFQHSAGELWSKGRDAEERLKKDTKHKILFAACSHELGMKETEKAMTKWQEENQALYSEAVAAEQAEAEKEVGYKRPLDAQNHLLTLPVCASLLGRARSEKDDGVLDCVGLMMASFQKSMNSITLSLKKVSQGLYHDGAHDWKVGLSDDCAIDVVLQKAATSILKVKGAQLKEAIDLATKELGIINDAIPKVIEMESVQQVRLEAANLSSLVTATQVQFTESAFAFAVNNIVNKNLKADDMQSILSTHSGYLLAEVNGSSEALIHPVLLAAAKNAM